jgi:hypothetical protein
MYANIDVLMTFCPYSNKRTYKGSLTNSCENFYIQSHFDHNFLQNRMLEREMQCTKLCLTFNYDTPAHDLDSDILLPACLSYCSTVNTSTISTCSSSSLVCTVPLLFFVFQHVGMLAFHFNLT